jgi:hypothetical protein
MSRLVSKGADPIAGARVIAIPTVEKGIVRRRTLGETDTADGESRVVSWTL